jgi:TPR repeat protein
VPTSKGCLWVEEILSDQSSEWLRMPLIAHRSARLLPATLSSALLAAFLWACAPALEVHDETTNEARRDHAEKTEDEAAKEAIYVLEKQATDGRPEAQAILGAMYQEGNGVPKDEAEAVGWYRKAAESGQPLAQYNLGVAYSSGTGVKKSDEAAVEWWRKAANAGVDVAQYNLGMYLHHGTGVQQDYTEAVAWWQKAAAQGNRDAQNALGVAYERGLGVPQDYVKAVEWYRTAAAQGDPGAQHNLGLAYVKGVGVDRDYAEGYKWLNIAATQDPQRSANARDLLAAQMSPADLAEGQRLTRDHLSKALGQSTRSKR